MQRFSNEFDVGGILYMDEREKMIRLWFSMWLEKKDLGIDDIFAENVIYTESWGPCYRNREIVNIGFRNGIREEA